jgi:hypothetical protein
VAAAARMAAAVGGSFGVFKISALLCGRGPFRTLGTLE